MLSTSSRASGIKFIGLLSLATLLSALTVVLGVAPFRVLRVTYGRSLFWLSGIFVASLLAATGLEANGLIVLALVVLTGVYSEIEEHGGSVFTSGAVAGLASFGTTVLAIGVWLHETKVNLLAEARAELAPLATKMAEMNSGGDSINSTFNVDTLVQQMPSGLAITLFVALALGLILASRVAYLWRISSPSLVAKESLTTYRVPDATIWLLMIAILGSFLHHGIAALEIVSTNVLNVVIMLYFFQGLAVVTQGFRRFKISPFWQGIWYFLIVVQLFLLVSLVGMADFWLDFRERFTRRPAEPNKGF